MAANEPGSVRSRQKEAGPGFEAHGGRCDDISLVVLGGGEGGACWALGATWWVRGACAGLVCACAGLESIYTPVKLPVPRAFCRQSSDQGMGGLQLPEGLGLAAFTAIMDSWKVFGGR